MPKAVAIVEHLGLRKNPDCYKEILVGKTLHKRYSPKAIEAIQDCLKKASADDIWRQARSRQAP